MGGKQKTEKIKLKLQTKNETRNNYTVDERENEKVFFYINAFTFSMLNFVYIMFDCVLVLLV